MSIEKNVQIVKDFFAALGRGDKQGLLALCALGLWLLSNRRPKTTAKKA